MHLAGQDAFTPRPSDRSRLDDHGYILAVLLIGMAVTAVWMTALLPAWRQQAIREREAELVYRGEQYARAIALYRSKNNGALPQNIDILLSQKYLRKKYLDPITGEEFIYLGATIPGQITSGPGLANAPRAGTNTGQSGAVQAPPGNQPGIYGVQSKSTATSIKVYQGQQQYNMWPFTYQLAAQRGVGGGRSAGAPGTGRSGGRGDDTIIGGAPGSGRGPGTGPGTGRQGGDAGGRGPGGTPVRPGGGGPPTGPPTGGSRGSGS